MSEESVATGKDNNLDIKTSIVTNNSDNNIDNDTNNTSTIATTVPTISVLPSVTSNVTIATTSHDYVESSGQVVEAIKVEDDLVETSASSLGVNSSTDPNSGLGAGDVNYWHYGRLEGDYQQHQPTTQPTSYYSSGEYVYPTDQVATTSSHYELSASASEVPTIEYYEHGSGQLHHQQASSPSAYSHSTFGPISNQLAESHYLLSNNVEPLEATLIYDAGAQTTQAVEPVVTTATPSGESYADQTSQRQQEPETPGSNGEGEPTYLTLGYQHKYG